MGTGLISSLTLYIYWTNKGGRNRILKAVGGSLFGILGDTRKS